MKAFGIKIAVVGIVIGSAATAANAAPITVFEQPVEPDIDRVSADFGVDRALGRAWVDVELLFRDIVGDEPAPVRVIMTKVDGLYYDPARKQVLYRTPTQTVVCAQDASVLWETYLKTTGNCPLTGSTEQRKVDDGFDVHEETEGKVVLDTKTSSAPRVAATSE